jgi:serine/threonine-protein kinase
MKDDLQPDLGVAVGDILDAKYRVDHILGVGGMGVVVAAHHLKLDERVAIKLLLPEALGDTEAIVRFEREARASVKIKNEHIARVTDVATLESGVPYMVMEYLEGEDLAARLEREGPMAVERAADFVLQACEALSEAHRLGIIHRDLKPANLFCVRRAGGGETIKLLDFGISKMPSLRGSGPGMSITKPRSIMGTPVYMSPEQMESVSAVDERSDIWGVGVLLYELLTGKVPFIADNFVDLCLRIGTLPPPPMLTVRPDLPLAFEGVVLKCLQKAREDRFQNVSELMLALAPHGSSGARALPEALSKVHGHSDVPLTSAVSSKPSTPPSLSWWHTGRAHATSRRTKLLGAAAIGTLGFVGLVATWARRESTSEAKTPRHGIANGVTSASSKVASMASPIRTPVVSASSDRSFLVPSELPVNRAPPRKVLKVPRLAPSASSSPDAPEIERNPYR